MKFGLVTGLLGAAAAVAMEANPEVDEKLIQEDAEMEKQCAEVDYQDSDFVEVEADVEEDAERYKKAIQSSYKAHHGRTKKQIDAENKHILSTQKKCMNFVRKYRGHEKVCNWCRRMRMPAIRWKWVPNEKVWYRFYDGKWHYWGPSKTGFTHRGWTWYKGYWHHGGYVFKYQHKRWYRFQGGKWVFYKHQVPLKPGIPRGPRICRPFYILKKWGFPGSLSTKRLPRCRVGRNFYMWKNHKACRFLGGKLQYMTHRTCKVGKPHQWARVIRCVRGPVISGKGFNYKTGRGYRTTTKTHTKTVRTTTIGGLTLGKCYTFRAYKNHKSYLTSRGGLIYNSHYSGMKVWKVVKGKYGRNSVTLVNPKNQRYALRHQGYRAKLHAGRSTLWKKDASFNVGKFLRGSNIVSFRSVNYPSHFLAHDTFKRKATHSKIWIKKMSRNGKSFAQHATWYYNKAKC